MSKESRAAVERRYRGRVEAGEGGSTVSLRLNEREGWLGERRLKW